ncbi:MAG: penicillin-binding protein 2 [Candidatus Eremiobacteraeota bacterium]|nr:penicillin-binding protein 2 [Candidatus Eremiobacteraeota bacterium]
MRIAPRRAKVAFWLFVLVAAFLVWRLVQIQIVQGPLLAKEALEQRAQTIEVFARRGTIYDRTRTPLVRSLESESIYADPSEVGDKRSAAAKLAPVLGLKEEAVAAALGEPTRFRWLARKVSHGVADRVRALDLQGVNVLGEETGVRFWIAGRLASTALGFVGLDENGLAGVEYFYDKLLRGTTGKRMIEADPFQRAIPFGQQRVIEPARPGDSLVLTLDAYLQYETERYLRAQVKAFHARSGTALIVDPHSGEILALANVPDFDPAHYGKANPDAWRDRAIADAYEPGSTFKLITAAAALESGKVTTRSRFPARDRLEVNGSVIHNAEDGFMAGTGGTESLEDIIAYSHNVGAAEVGMAIGKDAEYRTIRKFGFGDPTHVDLPGENPGIVPAPADWSGTSLPTIAFGHGVSVTPLALARAYCAIANGGILVRPRIVSAILDAQGRTVYRYPAEVEGRAISRRTAATLQGFLRQVVLRGTGNPTARVAGYTTAGKTGTAQVVENGRYAPGEYIASFVGYIPAEAPRYVILVKVERPRGAIYGSVVAAPVFAQIARAAMLHAGILPPPARLVRGKAGAKAPT